MKKTLALIGLCFCVCAVAQPTPTPARTNTVRRVIVNAQSVKDSLALSNAKIESLDRDFAARQADFAVRQAEYTMRRNELLRQRDQLQSLQTNLVPVTAPIVKPNR